MTLTSYIRSPRTAQPVSLTAPQVAGAYHYPPGATGSGCTVGVVELGGAYVASDLATYCAGLGVAVPSVTVTGTQGPDPQGADGEVALDVQVIAGVAPGARQKIYFASNTDSGFAGAIGQAVADGVTVISISWGGPENGWSTSGIAGMEKALLAAKAAGIPVCVAAGDAGADDGTGSAVTDYPASSPNVVACGGTRLVVDASGVRLSETVWDDSPRSSATGGGVSSVFAGRDVPDVAGNADPDSGYQIVLHGQRVVVGGTSAVAPLYAGLVCLLTEALGRPVGDLVSTVAANPTACYDVSQGDNGAYRAGPGRDETTGFGVVDGGLLLTAEQGTAAAPGTGGAVTKRFTSAAAAELDYFASTHQRWHAAIAWTSGAPV